MQLINWPSAILFNFIKVRQQNYVVCISRCLIWLESYSISFPELARGDQEDGQIPREAHLGQTIEEVDKPFEFRQYEEQPRHQRRRIHQGCDCQI